MAVLDDYFPNLLTAFRVAEYNAFLGAYPRLTVLSKARDFAAHHASYADLYPSFAPRVQPFSRAALKAVGAAYMNFLNNAFRLLPDLERRRIPFLLTLYPGGGLGLREHASDKKLEVVLASPLLHGLTVTLPLTRDYVAEFARTRRLPLPPMQLIRGVVVHPAYFEDGASTHDPYFGEGKRHMDVCFVAEKYMPRGENKGYPEFIALAAKLRGETALRFHVVGGFSADDVDVSLLGDRLTFHGRLETSRLLEFFRSMDLIVSPNKPFVLHPGNFDGFPTGACVEASLSGVAVMASDPLEQNPGYAHGEAMLIAPPTVDAMHEQVRFLLEDHGRTGSIARRGQALTRRWYHPSAQIAPRMKQLESFAASAKAMLL
jgi:lipopolysaccharide transport system ATP-binding protein